MYLPARLVEMAEEQRRESERLAVATYRQLANCKAEGKEDDEYEGRWCKYNRHERERVCQISRQQKRGTQLLHAERPLFSGPQATKHYMSHSHQSAVAFQLVNHAPSVPELSSSTLELPACPVYFTDIVNEEVDEELQQSIVSRLEAITAPGLTGALAKGRIPAPGISSPSIYLHLTAHCLLRAFFYPAITPLHNESNRLPAENVLLVTPLRDDKRLGDIPYFKRMGKGKLEANDSKWKGLWKAMMRKYYSEEEEYEEAKAW